MQLQSFEQGVERMVGGVFQRAFKSSVRPIHIGRKLIRAIDAERTVDAAGKAVAPNVFVVHLNEKDRAAFGDLEKPLIAELVGAAVAVSAIAGLTGSASGGQVIALPEIAPHYLDRGVDPEQLHRVVAISSGALDSLPHNGYVVTTIRAICGESHQNAYWPVAVVSVLVPVVGTALAILLFQWF